MAVFSCNMCFSETAVKTVLSVSLSSDRVTNYRRKIKRNVFEFQYSVFVAFAMEHILHLEMKSDSFLWFLSDRKDKGLLMIYLSGGFKIQRDKKFCFLCLHFSIPEYLYVNFELKIIFISIHLWANSVIRLMARKVTSYSGFIDNNISGEPTACSVFVVNIICGEFASCNYLITNTFLVNVLHAVVW
jgi:hypothetical protein